MHFQSIVDAFRRILGEATLFQRLHESMRVESQYSHYASPLAQVHQFSDGLLPVLIRVKPAYSVGTVNSRSRNSWAQMRVRRTGLRRYSPLLSISQAWQLSAR